MTLTDNGNGRFALVLDPGERAMLVRAVRRFGVSSLKSALEAWLRSAGGPEAEAEEIKKAYLESADDTARAAVRQSLGVS